MRYLTSVAIALSPEIGNLLVLAEKCDLSAAMSIRLKHHATFDSALDARIVDIFDQLCFDGHRGFKGSLLMASLAHFLPMFQKEGTGKLPRAKRALKAWHRLAATRTRGPLPLLHLVLVVKRMVFCDSDGFGRAYAAWCLCAFVTYFRPSEMMTLLREDLLEPPLSAPHWILRLHPEERRMASKRGDFEDGVALDAP